MILSTRLISDDNSAMIGQVFAVHVLSLLALPMVRTDPIRRFSFPNGDVLVPEKAHSRLGRRGGSSYRAGHFGGHLGSIARGERQAFSVAGW
jgi:hypothetical protein